MYSSSDITKLLEKETNIPAKQWKRISKVKDKYGNSIRYFEDKQSGLTIATLEKTDG